jgi:hypothetical protein
VDANNGTITAIAPLKSSILVLHADSAELIRGSVPPPGTDFIQEPFLAFGCLDPFSVATWNDRVIFANAKGIYMTDGAGWNDLTAKAGMSSYYQAQMASYTTSWRLGGGIYRNHYILSINNGTSNIDTFVVNLATGAFWRFSNFHANAFLNVSTGAVEECWMARTNGVAPGLVASCWNPTAAVRFDGDSSSLFPVWETPMHMGYDRLHRRWVQSFGLQRWKYVYYSMNIVDFASDFPSVAISYTTNPAPNAAYTAIPTTASRNTTFKGEGRRAITTGNKASMLGLKLAAQNGAGDYQIFELGLDYTPLERGALPQ